MSGEARGRDSDVPVTRAGRRAVLKAGIGLGIELGLVPSLAWAQPDPASLRPREGDLLVRANDPNLKPLAPEDIPVGARQTMAWAMAPEGKIVRSGSRLNRVLLLRFDVEALSPETRARAAEGVVAYTAICTHNGCDVEEWLEDEQLLSCPCHFGRFNPRDGAAVVDGPAPRVLPALPLKLVSGILVVARSFTSPVGFLPA